jgi:hypothetical protein
MSANALSVDIRAMADFDDHHFLFGVVDDVNDAVVVLAHAVACLMAGQRFAPRRPGLRGQRADLLDDLCKERLRNSPQFPLGALFDQYLIGARHASDL